MSITLNYYIVVTKIIYKIIIINDIELENKISYIKI